MIDKQFDDILRRKLKNLTDTSNSDWSVFEHKLDSAQMPSEAKEEGFDHTIKQKLAGISTKSVSSDWSTFERILDQDQLTDDLLDDRVSQEMNNMRAPYRRDHWELLHNTLEYQKQRNDSIIGYKIIELSLLLIVLLSANNIYKYLPSTFEVEKPLIYANIDQNNDKNTKELSTKISIIEIASDVKANNSSANNTLANNTKAITKVAMTEQLDEISSPFTSQLNTPTTNEISTADTYNKINPINNRMYSKVPVPLPIVQSNVIRHKVQEADQSIEKMNSIVVTTIDILDIKSATEQIFIENKSEIIPQNILLNDKSRKSIFVYAGLDNNLVNSPFDDVYDTEGFRTYGIGYSAGVEYGIKKGNKEIALGISFSNRAYEPRIIEELTGNPAFTLFETSLDHIEFNIMSLSAGLKYMLLETDNWGLDIGLGASANIVVNSDYKIETRTIRNGQFVSSRGGRVPFSDLDDKPLHDGIFESGSLKENTYFTTDISFGIHKHLNKNTTFTLRPEYSVHSFSDGIGPNNDLINNLSLNLGVRYTL